MRLYSVVFPNIRRAAVENHPKHVLVKSQLAILAASEYAGLKLMVDASGVTK